MKKVLIITYYWPPGTGAGVFRWLKFSKHLRQFGWEPVIYTPENPEAQGTDHSLEADIPAGITVLKQPIREPYRAYKMLTGRHREEKIQSGFLSEQNTSGWTEKAAKWIRGNLFIPDARKFWIKPSVRSLSKWLADNPADAIVSTGPPHSMHLIALALKRKMQLPWLADFRDPWTQIDFYDKLMLTRFADRKHRRLEQEVLRSADKLVTVSEHGAKDMEELSGREVHVIANGFDPDDFKQLPEWEHDSFSITHMGSMNADRNPLVLWQSLQLLVETDPAFRSQLQLRFIGKTDFTIKESLRKLGLLPFCSFTGPLPHREAIRETANSAILLLPLNNTPNVMGITTGKLFDYLPMGRPVLCIGPPEGDAGRIIRHTGSGTTVDFSDQKTCTKVIQQWFDLFCRQKLYPDRQKIHQYQRSYLTQQLAGMLDSL
ncbi:MAG: glycosyl transferase family 1 [Bacteroidia bacterium]|nr:MAG: glycosyl transferase family 1 [Bacteroidia bacterium]